ncbi:MAG: hypothetical protein WBD31_18610 [Rubripirellula sp.]
MTSAAQSKLALKCNACDRALTVPGSAAGKIVTCPCGQKLKVATRTQPVATASHRQPAPALKATIDSLALNRRPVAAPKPKITLAIVAGWGAALLAIVCLCFGMVCLYLGVDIRALIVMVFTAGLCAAVSVACLNPVKRTPAIRLLGGVFSAIFFLTFIASVVAPPEGVDLRRKGMMLTFAVFMAGVAYKGRWPSDKKG